MKTLLILIALALISAAPVRDPKQVAAFRKTHACPATNLFTGACKGWVVDHVKPICFGGADHPDNMTWQDQKVSYLKDAFEREACALKKKCEVKP